MASLVRRDTSWDGYWESVPMPLGKDSKQLLKAAPDLLDALRECVSHLESLERLHEENCPYAEQGRAAIAKAMGVL